MEGVLENVYLTDVVVSQHFSKVRARLSFEGGRERVVS